jgi:hypothetical protein
LQQLQNCQYSGGGMVHFSTISENQGVIRPI